MVVWFWFGLPCVKLNINTGTGYWLPNNVNSQNTQAITKLIEIVYNLIKFCAFRWFQWLFALVLDSLQDTSSPVSWRFFNPFSTRLFLIPSALQYWLFIYLFEYHYRTVLFIWQIYCHTHTCRHSIPTPLKQYNMRMSSSPVSSRLVPYRVPWYVKKYTWYIFCWTLFNEYCSLQWLFYDWFVSTLKFTSMLCCSDRCVASRPFVFLNYLYQFSFNIQWTMKSKWNEWRTKFYFKSSWIFIFC